MRVRRITADGDWSFGKGRADYVNSSKAIRQNVVTRLRSFTDDWFLDITNGLPWIELLGNRNTENQIIAAVEKTVLETEGVRLIERLRLVRGANRTANIELIFVDIFDERFTETIGTP